MSKKSKKERCDRVGRRIGGSEHRAASNGGTIAWSAGSKRKFGLLIALLSVVLLFLAFDGPYLSINRLVSTAMQRYDHDRAEHWLSVGDRWKPWLGTNATAELLAARLARRKGRITEMESRLDAALDSGASVERVERERTLASVQSGEVNVHELTVTTWLTNSDSDSAEICDAYANGLAVVSRLDDALNVLDAWHKDDPGHPVPLYRMGKIYEYYDNLDAATDAYRKSLNCDESYLPSAFRLGMLHLDAKKPADAELLFRRCSTARNPLASQIGVAVCQAELGNTEEAKEILSSVLQHSQEEIQESYTLLNESPETFTAAVELGKLEVNSGRYAEGIYWLDKAIEYNPRDLAARYSRAVALRQSGKEDQAEGEFERIDEAKRALEQVNVLRNQIGREPTLAQPRLELGQLLLKYESERNGIFWLRSALTVDPDNSETHRILADHYRTKIAKAPEFRGLAEHHQRCFEMLRQAKPN